MSAMVRGMTYPSTLIFVDLPSDDPSATGEFYAKVFGWTNEGRPHGIFHRLVPGQNFQLDDGSQSPIGNLHIGIYNVNNARPHPNADGVGPRELNRDKRGIRMWVLVSDDDDQNAILDRAVKEGAKELWRDHFWAEFNGFNCAFEDPWGNHIIMWTKGGDSPKIPEGWTNE